MSNYCNTCQYYKVTHDGPHCNKGRIKPVSPISMGDCWEPITEKPDVVTKVCKRCGRELPVSEFGRHPKTKDGYQPVCRECRSAEMKGVLQGPKKKDGKKTEPEKAEDNHHLPMGRRPKHPSYVDEATGVTMKWCNCCQQFKPITDFHKHKTNKDGHATECKACHNARTVEAQRRRIAARKAAAQASAKTENGVGVENVNGDGLQRFDIQQIVQELRRRGYHGVLTMEV